MPDPSPEPFVILERPLRRWKALRGRKPAILLIDRDGGGLDHPLAAEGFDVYRTTGRDSALELLRTHPSILMSLLRAGLPGLDPAPLIRELQDSRPGLWVGLVCDPDDRAAAAAGYEAGAVDLFHPATDPRVTVARLIRGVPWALRRREAADRRIERRLGRSTGPPLRRWARKASSRLGLAALLLVSLGLGAALAAATRAWHESQERWSARFERFMSAMESSRPPGPDRQFDRWQRFEQMNLQRQSQQELQSYRRDQLEEERLQDFLRRLPPPQYPGNRQ